MQVKTSNNGEVADTEGREQKKTWRMWWKRRDEGARVAARLDRSVRPAGGEKRPLRDERLVVGSSARDAEQASSFPLLVALLAFPPLVSKESLHGFLELASLAHLNLLGVAPGLPILSDEGGLLLAGVKDLVDVGGRHRPVGAFRLGLETPHDQPLALEGRR